MATSNVDTSTNLTADVYGISNYVNEMHKQFNPAVSDDTAMLGIFGYMNQIMSDMYQNSIVMASEFSNESIPTKAKFEKNIIAHALSLGIEDINATPAQMDVLLTFNESDISNWANSKSTWEFIFDKDTPIYIGDFCFHTDYDIQINKVSISNSTKSNKFAYTARYLIDIENPISDITNPYLAPPISINSNGVSVICVKCTLRQVEKNTIHKKILSDNSIASKTTTFEFEGQLAAFNIDVTEGDKTTHLVPVYDGLSSDNKKYPYFNYTYVNSNTIRIKFDRSSYQPRINSDVRINIQTTSGESGNFTYNPDVYPGFAFESEKYGYSNIACEVMPVNGESLYGTDKKSIKDLKKLIPKESLSRGSITTGTDLINYFNSINNEDSVVHVFKKEDNILRRIYYAYSLMKDSDGNVVPTNTIPIFINSSSPKGKIYLESGTPIYFFKNRNIEFSFMRNKFVGYLAGPSNSADINKIMTGDNINFDYFQITEFDEETIDSITYKETEDSVTIRKFSSEAAGKYYRYENGVVTPNVGFVAINEGDKYEEDVTYYSKITNVNGEVLSISYKSGKAQSLTVLIDKRIGEYYKEVINAYQMTNVKSYPDFIYNCPMSIVVVDENSSQSHKASTKYYLDIINENSALWDKILLA